MCVAELLGNDRYPTSVVKAWYTDVFSIRTLIVPIDRVAALRKVRCKRHASLISPQHAPTNVGLARISMNTSFMSLGQEGGDNPKELFSLLTMAARYAGHPLIPTDRQSMDV